MIIHVKLFEMLNETFQKLYDSMEKLSLDAVIIKFKHHGAFKSKLLTELDKHMLCNVGIFMAI